MWPEAPERRMIDICWLLVQYIYEVWSNILSQSQCRNNKFAQYYYTIPMAETLNVSKGIHDFYHGCDFGNVDLEFSGTFSTTLAPDVTPVMYLVQNINTVYQFDGSKVVMIQ